MEIVLTILVVVAFSVILTLISMRNRNKSWEGTVTEIKSYTVTSNRGDDMDHREEGIAIKYQEDSGKRSVLKINMPTFNKFFTALEIGDRLIKKSGEYLPQMEKRKNE